MREQLGDWVRWESSSTQYLVPDGVFGPRTEVQVEAYQAAIGLPVTGDRNVSSHHQLRLHSHRTSPEMGKQHFRIASERKCSRTCGGTRSRRPIECAG